MTRSSEWDSAFHELTTAGCQVRLFPDSSTALYIHEKLILDDPQTTRDSLLIGSQNASVTSLTRNRELGIILGPAHGGAGAIAAASATLTPISVTHPRGGRRPHECGHFGFIASRDGFKLRLSRTQLRSGIPRAVVRSSSDPPHQSRRFPEQTRVAASNSGASPNHGQIGLPVRKVSQVASSTADATERKRPSSPSNAATWLGGRSINQ